MKIDRARFLVLTGAISGAIAAASATEACSTATTATPDAGGSHGGDSGSGQDATNGTDSGGGTDTGTGGETGGGDGSATCDDSVGNAGACAVDGGAAADAGDAGDAGNGCLTDVLCGNLLGALKPKVAQNAIACIVTGPACEGGTTVEDCVSQALGNACADPTGSGACDQIAAVCADAGADAGLSSADCLKLTAGLTSGGRTDFVSCMTEGGLSCGVVDPKSCLQFP
jgi:hypothetical protein